MNTNRSFVRIGQALIVIAAGTALSFGHDAITTKVTFDREIVRLMISHCGSCHNPNGSAFSLMTYDEARPWAKDIGEEVLQRRMPPWGGVKGFGDFRNDKGLTEEQLELIVDWEEGGAPEGDAKDIPADIKFPKDPDYKVPQKQIVISGDTRLKEDLKLDAILPKTISPKAGYQVIAQLPDGSIEPLVWFQNYGVPADLPQSADKDKLAQAKKDYEHPFLLRHPLTLPAGTLISGVPSTDTVVLLPVTGPPAQLTGALVKPARR